MDQKPAPTSPNFIYALHHPKSLHVYVGKTSKGMQRPQDHVHPSHLKQYPKLPRTKWVKALLARGLKPEIVVLEELATPDLLDDAERFYIAQFRAMGVSLLNCTDGGDGIVGHVHSAASREKMSKTRKARMAADPRERERMSTMAQQFWDDPIASAKVREQRASTRDVPRTADVVAKIAAGVKGKPKSDTHRDKIREAAKLRWQDPAYRANQVEKQRLAHGTPEARALAAEWAKLAGKTKRKPKGDV